MTNSFMWRCDPLGPAPFLGTVGEVTSPIPCAQQQSRASRGSRRQKRQILGSTQFWRTGSGSNDLDKIEQAFKDGWKQDRI